MVPSLPIDLAACRLRQSRFVERMTAAGVDWAVLTSPESVQWLTGVRVPFPFRTIASIDVAGEVALVVPHKVPDVAAADRVEAYVAKRLSTMRSDQFAGALETWLPLAADRLGTKRVGLEFSSAPAHLVSHLSGDAIDLEPDLFDLRRCKQPDEIALIRRAIAGTEAMYRTARALIAPGLTELAMFNALQSVAVETFGEPLTGTGNDYRCNARGGAPRDAHPARAGELWILDLGPAYRGYFADNARTLAVTEPTDEQLEAWHRIVDIFALVESTVRPGTSCRELFETVSARLASAPCGRFDHHLGHGIGLHPHEAPRLNPNWDDCFREGDVFTVEPGLYDAERLRHGIRLENDYRVTADGVELLTPFPLELR
ncbi:MAG TPA: Xaa-Pro peptidase family protein [Pirellulaceae bacterium]|nr:Xaa-Pro peptidase family protein [Pirellulaceae bacterium]